MTPPEEPNEQDSIWKKRFEREKAVRKEAERLLEKKSLEAYQLNCALEEKMQALQTATEELKGNNEELVTTLEFVNQQKQIISDKNNDINKSIEAAWRIQKAIMPSEEVLKKIFGEAYFVFYQPKNVVSGDFYWICEQEDKMILVVADCTGHGVQGAFMSLIGTSLLNTIILEHNIFLPNIILYYLNTFLHDFFNKNNQKVHESMDLSVLVYHKKSKKLRYAGAMQSLYYVKENQFAEIKGNRSAIGMARNNELVETFYDLHEIVVNSPTTFYLSTDGYKDQFGGKDNRKFMAKNLKKLLFNNHKESMPEQGRLLKQQIEEWQGNDTQTDDMLVFGFKL
jgi:two-component system, sensor histidine kinase LadS